MTTAELRADLVALLRAFAAEEYQRDANGDPTGVWQLLHDLEELLEETLLDDGDPLRWLPEDSTWQRDVDPATRAAYGRVLDRLVAEHPDWRVGQRAFVALTILDPKLADEVRGTRRDPFHHDDRLNVFHAYVTRRWEEG